jgi:hypothetical protein
LPPLLVSLQFGRFLLAENSDNPVEGLLGLLHAVCRSITLGGSLACLGLNFLTSNLSLNKLVQFDTQQAIFVDVALFLPGLPAVATSSIASGSGFELPPGVTELGSDALLLVPPSPSHLTKSHLFLSSTRVTKMTETAGRKSGMARESKGKQWSSGAPSCSICLC